MSALQEFKCPNCDGALEFDSGSQKMKCPYCDSEFEMEALCAYDAQLEAQPREDNMQWDTAAGGQWQEGEAEGLRLYICNTCGGEVVGDATTAATECPFCGNPVVMMGQFAGNLKPDCVIPFKLDKRAAIEALTKHYRGKVLLPKVFKDQNHIDEIKGVYVPFWLFDADADADIHYNATRIRRWKDSEYEYTETSYYSVLRAGQIGFERVPVDGSSKMDDTLMESIEPFNFADAVDFQTAYLAGYLADKYDVTAEQSVDRANDRIRSSTEQNFAATIHGFSSVVPVSTNIRLANGVARYALYPVWLLNTSWNGKKYVFAMNGQTGKLVGDLPMDKNRFWTWFAGLFAAGGALTFALLWLFNML